MANTNIPVFSFILALIKHTLVYSAFSLFSHISAYRKLCIRRLFSLSIFFTGNFLNKKQHFFWNKDNGSTNDFTNSPVLPLSCLLVGISKWKGGWIWPGICRSLAMRAFPSRSSDAEDLNLKIYRIFRTNERSQRSCDFPLTTSNRLLRCSLVQEAPSWNFLLMKNLEL